MTFLGMEHGMIFPQSELMTNTPPKACDLGGNRHPSYPVAAETLLQSSTKSIGENIAFDEGITQYGYPNGPAES